MKILTLSLYIRIIHTIIESFLTLFSRHIHSIARVKITVKPTQFCQIVSVVVHCQRLSHGVTGFAIPKITFQTEYFINLTIQTFRLWFRHRPRHVPNVSLYKYWIYIWNRLNNHTNTPIKQVKFQMLISIGLQENLQNNLNSSNFCNKNSQILNILLWINDECIKWVWKMRALLGMPRDRSAKLQHANSFRSVVNWLLQKRKVIETILYASRSSKKYFSRKSKTNEKYRAFIPCEESHLSENSNSGI